MQDGMDEEAGQVRLGENEGGFRPGDCKEVRDWASAEVSDAWKIELEKQIACVDTHETKMMELADQEAYHQNLCGRIFRSTAAPVAATALASGATTVVAPASIFMSAPEILLTVAVTTAIDDGDGDLLGASKPKRGDGLDVFVADLGNAGSYVNTVRGNQQKKSERRKDMAYYKGVATFERPTMTASAWTRTSSTRASASRTTTRSTTTTTPRIMTTRTSNSTATTWTAARTSRSTVRSTRTTTRSTASEQ